MADDLNEVKEQLKAMNQELGKISHILVRQEENIKHHIYRTDLLEDSVKILKALCESMAREFKEALAPLQKHVNMMEGVFRFIGIVATIVGIAVGVAKLFIYCGFSLPF